MKKVLLIVLLLALCLPVQGQRFRLKQPRIVNITIAASDSANKDDADYICDGTNDEVEIQAAINALTASGGIIYMMEGTYSKGNATAIELLSNMKLIMSPATTIELAANPGNDPIIFSANTKTNVTIEGGILDGNKAAQTTITGIAAMGIRFIDTTDSCIKNVTVKDIGTSNALSGYGIYLNNSDRNRITECVLTGSKRENLCIYNNSSENVVSNNVAKDGDDRNYVLHDAQRNIFSSNVSIDSTGFGIDLYAACVGNSFTGNVVYSSGNNGITLSTTATYNTFTGNLLLQNDARGISCAGSYNVFQGNYFYDNSGAGINIASTANYCVIGGNSFYDNGGVGGGDDNGIGIYGDYTVINGNQFWYGSNQQYGIRIFSGGTNNSITANNLINAGIAADYSDAGSNNYPDFSFTSADLTGKLTDETGTGVIVCATSPTLTTPIFANATISVYKTMNLELTVIGGESTYINGLWGRGLDDATDEYVVFGDFIPNDFTGSSNIVVTWRWAMKTTQTGDDQKKVRWDSYYGYSGSSGAIPAISSTTSQTSTLAVNEVAGTIHETTHTITNLSAGNYLSIRISRDANHATDDTAVGDVMVYANVYITYPSNKLGVTQ